MATQQILRIRNAQLGALGLTAFDVFLERLARHVSRVFPGHADFLSTRSGKQWLQRGVDRARSYGVNDRHGLSLFSDLWAALGADFDRRPEHGWIRELLEDRGLGSTARLYLVYRQLPSRCPQPPLGPPPFDDEDSDEPDTMAMPPPPMVPLTVGPDAWA